MNTDNKEERLKEAALLVLEYNSGSTSLLQRKLRLGYNEACSLMRELYMVGIVGEFDNTRPRKVLVTTKEEIEQKLNQ